MEAGVVGQQMKVRRPDSWLAMPLVDLVGKGLLRECSNMVVLGCPMGFSPSCIPGKPDWEKIGGTAFQAGYS